MNLSESEDPEFTWHLSAGIVYLTLGFTSLSLNILLFCLMWTDKVFQTTTYYILVRQLLIADGMLAIMVGMIEGIAVIEQSRLGPIVSHIQCFFLVFAWFYAMIIYVLIAFNRMIAIVFAKQKITAFISVQSTYIQIGVAICYNLILTGYFTFPKPALVSFYRTMTIYWDSGNVDSAKIGYVFNAFSNGTCIGIQWICSSIILLKVWKVRRKIGASRSISAKTSNPMPETETETGAANQKPQSQPQQNNNDWKKQVSFVFEIFNFCIKIPDTVQKIYESEKFE